VLFLNGERGLSVARAVLQAGHKIVRIVVPDTLIDSLVAAKLSDLDVEVVSIKNINDGKFIKQLSALRPQLLIVAGYPTIFRKPLLNIAENGAINLHGGRLPQYRGGSPLNWQIINGETVAGISVTKLTDRIDAGDVLSESEISISTKDTINTIHMRANELFSKLTLEVLAGFDTGRVSRRVQSEQDACYWHQRNDEDGWISWRSFSAIEVYNFVRALTRPYAGAFSYSEGERVRLFEVAIPDFVLRGTPGRVCYVQGNGPYVVCRDRSILVRDYKFEKNDKTSLRHGITLE